MDTQDLSELLDTLDKLLATLDEIARSKSSLIKSMVAAGQPAATAVDDFYDTVRRFTTHIDDTVKEIKRLSHE
jgi:hypothetical protein